jgi:hypothetical protein
LWPNGVAVLVTVRRSSQRNASMNAAGVVNGNGPFADQCARGGCPVSECTAL